MMISFQKRKKYTLFRFFSIGHSKDLLGKTFVETDSSSITSDCKAKRNQHGLRYDTGEKEYKGGISNSGVWEVAHHPKSLSLVIVTDLGKFSH